MMITTFMLTKADLCRQYHLLSTNVIAIVLNIVISSPINENGFKLYNMPLQKLFPRTRSLQSSSTNLQNLAFIVNLDCNIQGCTTSVRSRSGPVQWVGPTVFEMESDRTDRRLTLDRTDFRPIPKELGPTDRSGPSLTIGPNRSVGPIWDRRAMYPDNQLQLLF